MTVAATIYSDALMLVFGGLALFLFGINLMSDSLKLFAGNKLKAIIEKSTNTPFKGVLVGMLLTVTIQSSSGATALTIGLLRAGLMTFPQSVGIIMGANIGTTVTAFIIGLPIADFGPIFLMIGVIMTFLKSKKVKHAGGAVLGLGMLFYGLQMMRAGLKPLAATPLAYDLFHQFSDNWFLGAAFGTVFTTVVQSSSASIGILQKLYALNAQGIESITLNGAIPILLGANIGTTVTAAIAAIGGNTASKRAALVHVLFNVFAAVMFLILLVPYDAFILWLEGAFLKPYSMLTIAFAHAFQNIVTTIILFGLIGPIVTIVTKVIKDHGDKRIPSELFDEKLIEESPELALEYVKKGIIYMGSVVRDFFQVVREYSFNELPQLVDQATELEDLIDTYDERLHDYLIKISQNGLNPDASKRMSRDLVTIRDFERIGDHLLNIIEFFEERYRESQLLTPDSEHEMVRMYDMLGTMIDHALEAYSKNDAEIARLVLRDEAVIDELEELYRYRYIERLKQGDQTFVIAANYADILANMERIGDHLVNIAGAVLEPMYVPQRVIIKQTEEQDRDL
ncbi:MAG: Na/Pi cotransporter family protein [Acholeplasmataceae bacterium]|nr:Na/Pi cotransporter family protein [Acholeplasmataceae bacterium]